MVLVLLNICIWTLNSENPSYNCVKTLNLEKTVWKPWTVKTPWTLLGHKLSAYLILSQFVHSNIVHLHCHIFSFPGVRPIAPMRPKRVHCPDLEYTMPRFCSMFIVTIITEEISAHSNIQDEVELQFIKSFIKIARSFNKQFFMCFFNVVLAESPKTFL